MVAREERCTTFTPTSATDRPGADTRYLTSNPTIAGLEFMAGFSGPIHELAHWYRVQGYQRALEQS